MQGGLKFPYWLSQFRKENSQRGKLARFLRDDLFYPINAKNSWDGYEYLIEINADKKLQDAWLDAWNEYREIPRLDTPELLRSINRHAYHKKFKRLSRLKNK